MTDGNAHIIVDAEAIVSDDLLTASPSSQIHADEAVPTDDDNGITIELADQLRLMLSCPIIPSPPEPVSLTSAASAEPAAPPCGHVQCQFSTYAQLHAAFASMEKSERVQTLRGMLLATTAPRNEHNALLIANEKQWKSQCDRRTHVAQQRERELRSSFLYACRGTKLCRSAFAHLVSLDEQTVSRHATKVSNGGSFVLYDSNHSQAHKERFGIQRIVLYCFLTVFGAQNGLECPRGRGSKDEEPLRILSSSWTKVDVHDRYVSAWEDLLTAALAEKPSLVRPLGPISYNLFVRYWKEDYSTLRIAVSGSDFCDLCTSLKDDLAHLDSTSDRYTATTQLLQDHRLHAKEAFLFYKMCQTSGQVEPNGVTRHLVFDFAEKVLLPKVQKQPGQLHFVTGLKIDFFGVSSSNEHMNYVFGLPEGHWPAEKTANSVLSMLHHITTSQRIDGRPGGTARTLRLHADNCGGQNKNRYVLWYLVWLCWVGIEDVVELHFLIAGHTKNVCDGAFGHIKRRLSHTDAYTPGDMLKIIEESSSTTKCIPSTKVFWRNWKAFLRQFFYLPSALAITKYHTFITKRSEPGMLFAKVFSSDEESFSFNMLKPPPASSEEHTPPEGIQSDLFAMPITPLDETPSAQHLTRKNYLTVNILNRYYQNNRNLGVAYFQDGADQIDP